MGTFFHPITVTGTEDHRLTIDALVDTGATFSSLPEPLLNDLGIRPQREVRMRLADGALHVQRLGRALIEVLGEEDVSPILFGEPASPPILGAITLQTLLLGVDPARERLVPVEGWLV